jgi:hypothetical protein
MALQFTWNQTEPLVERLMREIVRVSISRPSRDPEFVVFWNKDGSGTKIRSYLESLIDQPEWEDEIGILNFELVDPNINDIMVSDDVVHLEMSFKTSIIEKLTIHLPPNPSAESGLVLIDDCNREILVAAGCFPFTLTIGGLIGLGRKFNPERAIDLYRREPLESSGNC